MRPKRRSFFAFLVNQAPQRYFVFMQFFMLAAIMLFLLYGSFQLFHEFSLSAHELESDPAQLKLQLKELYASLFMRLLAVFLGGFLANVLIGLMFLHRVTGPLVQVKRVIDMLSDGTTPDRNIKFRRGDFTPELADSLNKLIVAVKKKGSRR